MPPREQVNILLVDDQPAKLLTYEAILAPLNERLIKATSGREALEHLLRSDIAVVLVDVCMPDLDGFELASMIHQHPRHQHTAIIFVSAVHLTDIDRMRGYESGGVDYVSVPIVPEILRARVSVFADLYRTTRMLERLNADLEARVAERTAELEAAAERLRESEEMLLDSDRRKDEFLAMLSHELRNPLAPIRNAVEFLRLRGGQDPHVVRSHDIIDRQVDHLTRLVDDLLDVSRITRGKLEIRREPADLMAVLQSALEMTQPGVADRGQTLHVSTPAEPIMVQADVVRLTQIFLNLLDNASKFTPEGGEIWVRAEPDPEWVTIRIRDSGAGIAPEETPHLFQLFYQARDVEGTRKGLGIGLALVRRLVEMHGGLVEASSEGRNRGSEFRVRLPVAARTCSPVIQMGQASPGPSLTNRRVLVVDDNQDSAESLATLLRVLGNEVRTAHDGLAAIEAAATFDAEIVLLDIGMPRLDGYDTARRIRQQVRGAEVVLIAVTGWGQEADRRRSREAGFDAHLIKPISVGALEGLLSTIEELPRRQPDPDGASLTP